MGRERVFVIGLDAADPDLLEGWIEAGELPFFKQLMAEGTYGRLRCIPPVFSPVEWTSILTGTNPGKHGIFGFEKVLEGTRQIKVLNREDRDGIAFHEILAGAGRRVGVINMVMTYPAAQINGFVIAGMETPDLKSPGACYPAGLIEELQSIGCDYRISPGVAGLIMDGKMEEAIEALDQAADARYEATAYLMQEYDCDLMVVLFSEIDSCSHYFWSFHDQLHPDYDEEQAERLGDILLRTYRKHEQILQNLMSLAPDATFVICSDHGMGFNYEARYYLEELFTRLGWYCPADAAPVYASLRSLVVRVVEAAYWLIFRRLPMRYKRMLARLVPGLRSRVESIVSNVDWDRTRVWSNDCFFSIVINRTDRSGEPFFPSEDAFLDFRDAVIETLHALEELDTGMPLVEAVHTREALYSGNHVDDAPDLVIEWEDVRLRNGIRCNEIVIHPHEVEKNQIQQILSGEHRPHAILLMKGDPIRRDHRMTEGSILDIAPTVLYLSGQPIPRTMDGTVLLEPFRLSFRARNPVAYADEAPETDLAEGDGSIGGYSTMDAMAVRERLRKLGYVE
jgi:predicted AlkP superfamily phosphohydrolase/phosphomutase